MSWGKMTVGGVEYDLSHLNPFNVTVTPKGEGARTYTVRVTVTCHAFTRSWCAGDAEEARVPDEAGSRALCPVRHAHSLGLRAAIEYAAAGGKVYYNHKSPYLLVSSIPGLNGPYAIYFKAIKARTTGLDVVLDVRSAHHKPGLNTNLPRVTFATVIASTAEGWPIKPPKK